MNILSKMSVINWPIFFVVGQTFQTVAILTQQE